MISELTASLSAIKTSFELLKVISEAKEATVVQSATYELNRQLLELQLENIKLAQLISSQIEEINSLREQISKHDQFRGNLACWERKKTDAGFFVYALKKDLCGESQDIPYACPNCYHQDKISILQPYRRGGNYKFHIYKCPSCDTKCSMHQNPSFEEGPGISELSRRLNGDNPWGA